MESWRVRNISLQLSHPIFPNPDGLTVYTFRTRPIAPRFPTEIASELNDLFHGKSQSERIEQQNHRTTVKFSRNHSFDLHFPQQ